MVVQALALEWQIALTEKHEAYLLGSGSVDYQTVFISIPRTFMNQSGVAVKQILDSKGIEPSELIVVHDDIDLALGRIRIKTKGGHGGHKGILSILSTLEKSQFNRLRIGIGRPMPGVDAAEYVLEPFHNKEFPLIRAVIKRSVEALRCMMVEGTHRAMDRFNKKQAPEVP